MDVALHEPAGPASRWARTVACGAAISVMSLGSHAFSVPDEAPSGYQLIGDPASTPVIKGIIEAFPHDIPIEVYLEQLALRSFPRVLEPAACGRRLADHHLADVAVGLFCPN